MRSVVVASLLALGMVPAGASEPFASNDRCAGAQTISDGATATGTNVLASDDYRSRDGFGALGNDVVYSFTLTESRLVLVDLDETDFFADAYIRTRCEDSSSEVAFWGWMGGRSTMGTIPSTGSGVGRANLGPGTYFLIVDSEGGAGIPYRLGRFTLRFSTAPHTPGDRCDEPLGLGMGRRTGSTATAVNDYASANVPSAGRDLVFLLDVPGPQRLRIDTAGSSFDTTLYMRSVCDSPSSEIAAADDNGSAWQAALDVHVEAGTYYLVLDGWDAAAYGSYTLEVR